MSATLPGCIVDTNVVVTGLLTGNEASPMALILDGMLAARFAFVISDALLREYRKVLLRPALTRLHGLPGVEVDAVLTDIAHHAIVMRPMHAPPAPDPGDQFLWELLAAKADLVLVTGDKRLLRDRETKGRVISPRDFMTLWKGPS